MTALLLNARSRVLVPRTRTRQISVKYQKVPTILLGCPPTGKATILLKIRIYS
jgi:hypothetical protein